MLRTEDIQRLAWRIYPDVASELFLRWREQELRAGGGRRACCARRDRRAAAERGPERVAASAAATRRGALQLSMLAQATIQTIERYYLAIALLLKAGSGVITQKALEQDCQLIAQRINMLYGFNSPEFFDRALFENFIDLLRERGVIRVGAGGNLEFDEVLVRVAADAQLVLSEQIRPQRPPGHSCVKAGDFPGNGRTGSLAFPREAAAILARNTSAPGRPRGEASWRGNTKTIRTSG